MPRVALDWHSVTRIVLIDVDLRKFTQIIKANSRSRIDQSAGRRDHKHTGRSTRGPRKCICVGNFSTKIEAAQKGEHVRDWRATFRAQLSGEWKLRLVAQNHLGSFSPGISGREKENPMADVVLHYCTFRLTFGADLKHFNRSSMLALDRRLDGRNKDVIPPKRIDAETIVSSHIGRVKRGWNTVRKQFATVIINPITVNAAVYEARSAARRPRIFPTTTSGASVISQKDKRRQKLRFFG